MSRGAGSLVRTLVCTRFGTFPHISSRHMLLVWLVVSLTKPISSNLFMGSQKMKIKKIKICLQCVGTKNSHHTHIYVSWTNFLSLTFWCIFTRHIKKWPSTHFVSAHFFWRGWSFLQTLPKPISSNLFMGSIKYY